MSKVDGMSIISDEKYQVFPTFTMSKLKFPIKDQKHNKILDFWIATLKIYIFYNQNKITIFLVSLNLGSVMMKV